MVVNKNIKMPRWAKLIPPQKETAAPKEELEQEEVYTRKRCFRTLSKQMDEAMDHALDDSLAHCLSRLEDFLDAAAPNKMDPNPSRKRQKIGSTTAGPSFLKGLDTKLFDQQQQTDTPHDPLMLPVIVLQGPSYGADRRTQMDRLAKNLQAARGRSAVVQVQLSPQQRFHGMQDLVRHCHLLCPVLSSGPLRRRIVKRKKKRACSFSDLLLLWAQNVSDYDEIVVFLHADDSFYGREMHDFLHVLATRRAEQGIPLSVVLLGPPEGRRFMELKSSLQGYAGMMIRSLTLPSCEHLLYRFWKQLCIQSKFPILFPPNVLEAIERSCYNYHKSSQKTLYRLQQVLACRFVHKGSFLEVAHHPPIRSEIWQTLAWFLTDDGARQMLLGEATTDMSSTQLLEELEAAYKQYQSAQLSLQFMDSMQGNNTERPLFLLQPSFSGLLRKKSRRDLLEALLKLRKQTDERKSNKNAHSSQKVLTKYVRCVSLESAGQTAEDLAEQQADGVRSFINEIIVLVGNCRDGDDLSEVETLFDEASVGWVRHAAMAAAFTIFETNASETRSRRYLPSNEWDGTVDSLTSQPRKEMVAALFQAPNPWDRRTMIDVEGRKHLPVAYTSGIMYRLLHDRVAVTQDDWFEEFWQIAIVDAGAESPREDSFALFSLGVRYLKQCGLILEKLRVGSRSAIIYERAKLVWCATS